MINKILFLCLFIILASGSVFSQDNLYFNRSLQEFASKMQLSGASSGNKLTSRTPSSVEGSVYLNDKFDKGEIYMSGNEKFTGIPMRFNAYHGEIEVLMPDSSVWSLSKSSEIVKILLNKSALYYMKFLTGEGENSGYLASVYNGKSGLYRRDYKVFLEGTPSNGIVNAIPSKIVNRPKEYYLKADTSLPKFFKSSKDLAEILPAHSREINSFIKKEKLSLKKEEDLIRLATYIDTLN